MNAFSYIIMFLVIMAMITISKTAKIIAENERGAVFRLGKFMHILGPGFHILMPFVDKLDKINLNEKIPNWQSLSVQELEEKVKTIIIYNQ